MTQTVRITVHPFELHSALDSIHEWSSRFDWDDVGFKGLSGSPSFIIDLNVVADNKGIAQKFDGDRFNVEDPFWFRSDEEKTEIADLEKRINEMRNKTRTPIAEQNTAFSLMDHLREKTRG